MLQDAKAPNNKAASEQQLKSEVEYRKNLQEICNKIYAASNLDGILVDLKDEITGLFECDRLTVYVVDGKKRELVSRFKSGDEVAEIRIPVSNSSISGCSAFKQKLINIKDVYDDKEVASIDPDLKFDKSWDQKTGYVTKQVLVVPIIFKKFLLGAIQLINRTDGSTFTELDGESVTELAKILGIALYNQKRMAKTRPTKFDYLLENNILTQKEIDKAIADARQRKEPIENVLMNELKISKKDIGQSLSKFCKVPFVEFNKNAPIPGDLLAGLKIPFMRKNAWVPLKSEDDKIVIAIDNPNDLQRIDSIKALFAGKQLAFNVCLKDDILEYIGLFTTDEKEMASMDDIMAQLAAEDDEIEEAQSSLGEEDSAVVQLVNKVIIDAHNRGTSDIHIEPYPGKQNTQVRIRVDGACQMYQTLPYQYRNAIVSRLKIMADLDIAERRKPQDGKIKFKKYGGLDIELRVATVPTQGGMEDVVMRILAAGEPIPLANLGLEGTNFDNFVSIITQPYGIIFVCGPTGSGKTTSLHSALGYINKVETKIWTAEDPVEITQKGLRQVQVQSKIGFDFSAAMRAFLRADPDVIMVGEMRDKETTSIGIEASLTGHLVFSTLHTNSAPESITRLLDMGMDPFNFSDAILGILAQRLGRTLCKNCKEPFHPTQEEYDELIREFGGVEQWEKFVNIPYTGDLNLNKPVGCGKCNNSGYSGRAGIHELLMGTDDQKKLVQVSRPMAEIKAQALADGMTTLKQDGIRKIFKGNIDLVNVRKVCIE
ncbi:MAG: GspE/PulE family protein [Desulfobacterales bacterium]|uniref:GspE/PulE family protein n=1 Tax=Candidatus Desulfatibia vada TaxID=2841696 RepID=A0A8J6NY98_9BACT|nr:GspE/PulE family protein [Candidatus Desulfatibia vada]MBL6971832.1 GspE/PulE family protein [Desulfobacterales bacterium]